MKRLVFCFDGTWNRLDAVNPTNVVLTAQSITPVASADVVQIIHYDSGVGTTNRDKWTGGLFGEGLLDKIVDAYTFLVFNYEVGDELYVFGFSRGAFTARSFAGLLRNCGIVQRRNASRITEVVKRYEERHKDEDHDSEDLLVYRSEICPQLCVDQKEDEWRVANIQGYAKGANPVLRIQYIGVWDTVGSLGVPDHLLIAEVVNRKYEFHDLDLSSMVISARHAVSIDEQRESFSPTLWQNFEDLNASLGFAPTDGAAPYQQKWFPGVHGSVGGGGDIRGLSDYALDWILDGAVRMGLKLDVGADSKIYGLMPDYRAALDNTSKKDSSVLGMVERALPKQPRLPGPGRLFDVSDSAIARWREPAESLPERLAYRPATLKALADKLDALSGETAAGSAQPDSAEPTVVDSRTASAEAAGTHHTVIRGETLRSIALSVYGHAAEANAIFDANRHVISDRDRIYVGQVLFIPPKPTGQV
jgi:uncharacterized protein (DUF2235 family)